VTALPDNSGNSDTAETLSSSGTVYFLESSRATAGYHIDADKIAVTTLGTAVLSWNTNVSSNNCNLGDMSDAQNNKCLIGSKSDKFLWIEGRFDGSETTDYMISMHTVKLSLIRNIYVQNANTNDTAIFLRFADYNLVKNVKGGNVAYGVNISIADDNVVSEVYVHNTYYATYNNQSDNATVTRVLGANSSGDTFSTYDKDRNTYGFITAINSTANGIDFFRGDYDTIHSVLTVNNGGKAFEGDGNLTSTSGVKAANILFTNNATGISMENSFKGNIFTGKLVYGNNTTDCAGGTDFGISGSCGTEGSSDFTTASSSATAASVFKGKVTTTDSSNQSNTDGSESESSITDWMSFSNPFRGWGKDGSAFPSSGNRGRCSSGTCRIWDFRISSSDTTVLNKSKDGSNSNGTFIAGSTCPDAVHGDQSITDRRSTANTYLLNAMEIIGDFIGDDDGLCESNESCIYAPNWGAYQGEGDYYSQDACTFQDGTISGVTVYAYPTNGA